MMNSGGVDFYGCPCSFATAEQNHRPVPAGGQKTASDHGRKAERSVVTTQAATRETTQSGAYRADQGAVKAKIYTAVVDGKEITLIDTNALPGEEFAKGVRGRFGSDRVTDIAEKKSACNQ